jgi:hypothetical protein
VPLRRLNTRSRARAADQRMRLPVTRRLNTLPAPRVTLSTREVVRLAVAAAPPAAASAVALTAATVSLPYAKEQHAVTVTDAAVTAASKILIGWGTTADTSANAPDMDPIRFGVRAPTAGAFTLLVASDRPIGGPVNILYLVA